MPEEQTAVTSLEALQALRGAGEAFGPPCGGCGLRNPVARRSCLACGAPLGGHDEAAGPLPIDPPLVERNEQSQALSACIDRFVKARQGGVVTVTAPRGSGVTRMLRFVAERLLANGKVRLLTTTIREADGAYAPVTRLLWERFGITPSKSPLAAKNELVAEVHRVLEPGGPTVEHARRIVLAAGLPSDGHSGRWESEATRGMPRLVESLARFIQADAEQQPIAILVDNLDAAPEEGFAVFRGLVSALAKANVLVVMAGEPSLLERLGPLPRTDVRVPALSESASRELVRHLLSGLGPVPDELSKAVVRRGRGSPGGIREVLLALIESRTIITDEVPWRLDFDSLGSGGPVSVVDVIGFRLQRLDPEARGILARAAVVGEVFWEGAVTAMLRVEEDDAGDPFADHDPCAARVADALRRLTAAELIAPIEESELALEREYAFAIAGLRETVLRGEDEATQRRRHDVCASWLEMSAGSRSDDLARAIGKHLEKAGLLDAAARAYLRAARAARASYRGPQAVELFDRALSMLNAGDAPTRVDAIHDKGVVLALLGRVDEAARTFTEMFQLAHRYGARNKMAAALGRLGRIARGRGEFDTSQAYFEGALGLFQLAEDTRGIAGVEDDLGILAFIAGDFERAIEHSTRALEIRRHLEDPLGEALSTHNLGLVHFAQGKPRQARAHFERALALRERHSDIEGAVTTRNALAALAFERGDVDQAERIWREILELAEALGDKRMILYATGNLGEAVGARGDVALAGQYLDVADHLCSELDDKRAQAEIERSRAMLAKSAGDTDRAQFHFEQSLAIAQQLGVREAEALALRGLGETFAQTVFDPDAPRSHQADPYFEDAIRILEEVGATRELARTRAAYGTYLVERAHLTEGRKQLVAAVPVLERMELAEAGRMRGLLNSIGGGTEG